MKKNIYYYIGLFSYIGFAVAVPIIAGAYLGNILDKRFHLGSVCTIILLLFGVIDGFYNMIKIIKSSTKDD